MGSASSSYRVIYLDVDGRIQKINPGNEEQLEQLDPPQLRNTNLSLLDSSGAMVSIDPTMPHNTERSPYKLVPLAGGQLADKEELFQNVLTQVAEQFSRAFKINELKTEVTNRLAMLEKRVELLIRLAGSLTQLMNEHTLAARDGVTITQRSSTADHYLCVLPAGGSLRVRRHAADTVPAGLSPVCQITRTIKPVHFNLVLSVLTRTGLQEGLISNDFTTVSTKNIKVNSNFLDDSKKLTPRRDVPSYPKYMLSQQTIDALKKPTFDVWLWEANEMLSCLEHMYHDLGLVKDFSINPITLKRWLLCIHDNYKNNPFHNFRHCFCVTQMMYSMICLCSLQEKLSQLDILILMTAAVCHDLDHPGFNNT
ncbi:hypothetical protein fugu_000712 [Takifugu bimaculatus]|uniref:PDEase domain-containing protein n=1 Tax=Takifugu bimaculatus TaxID=433685 RepID=A0A4Z2CHF7_9TELE|nr:hypothetical protein fugu_000712 [Takifugu bimaculatus]